MSDLRERDRVDVQVHFSEAAVRCYRDTLQTSDTIHRALFLFGLNRGIFLSEGGRCCLSVPMGEAEVGRYLSVVEEFLAEFRR